MRAFVGSLALVAACWSSKPVAEPPKPEPPAKPQPPASRERRGILRIDHEPAARKFQGVWLEIGDAKWIVDYRARQLWKWFADREVIVTGGCYEPIGAAIMKPHFRIDQLRFAEPQRGLGPYLSLGPEHVFAGEVVAETAPPGSKAAGSTRNVFVADDGTRYGVLGETNPTLGTALRVRARVLEPDLSYTARSGDVDLWIVDPYGEATTQPRSVPCPGDG